MKIRNGFVSNSSSSSFLFLSNELPSPDVLKTILDLDNLNPEFVVSLLSSHEGDAEHPLEEIIEFLFRDIRTYAIRKDLEDRHLETLTFDAVYRIKEEELEQLKNSDYRYIIEIEIDDNYRLGRLLEDSDLLNNHAVKVISHH